MDFFRAKPNLTLPLFIPSFKEVPRKSNKQKKEPACESTQNREPCEGPSGGLNWATGRRDADGWPSPTATQGAARIAARRPVVLSYCPVM